MPDIGKAKASQMAGSAGVGLKRARSIASDLLDRQKPDGFEGFRHKVHSIDNPTPGHEYAELVAAGGRFVPAMGRLLCRQAVPHSSAKDAGLLIPEIADVHRGPTQGSEYEVLAVGIPCDGVDLEDECSGGCGLKPGTRVIAGAHTGADVREWGGPDLFVLRCRRIMATVDE